MDHVTCDITCLQKVTEPGLPEGMISTQLKWKKMFKDKIFAKLTSSDVLKGSCCKTCSDFEFDKFWLYVVIMFVGKFYKYRVVAWLPGNALTCYVALLCWSQNVQAIDFFFLHLHQRSFWLVSSLQQPIFSVALVVNKVTWSKGTVKVSSLADRPDNSWMQWRRLPPCPLVAHEMLQ